MTTFSPLAAVAMAETTFPAGRVAEPMSWSGCGAYALVGWLDNLGIRLNSAPTGVEFGWSWG